MKKKISLHILLLIALILIRPYICTGMEKNTNDSIPALMKAASKGETKDVITLLNNGAEVNVKNSRGMTALMYAAEKGYNDVVKILLEKGADINEKGNNGFTALMLAAYGNHTDTVEILLASGAEVNVKNSMGRTPLMYAAGGGHTETVKALLNGDADVNVKDNYGDTALILTTANGYTGTVKVLLDNGAEVNAKDTDGKTTSMLASESENTGDSPRLDLKNKLERFIECNNNLLDMDNADELIAILTSMEISQPAYTTSSREELNGLIMAEIVFIQLHRNINDFDSTKKYLDEIKVHAERMEKTYQDPLFMIEYHILMTMHLIQTGDMENALQELKIYEQKISPFNIPEDREYALSMKGCINNNKLDEARNLFQKRITNLFDLQLGYITDRWEGTDKLIERLKDEQ